MMTDEEMKYWRKNLSDAFGDRERKLQIRNALENTLEPVQLVALKHVRWLFYGGRATGRTRTICIAAIIHAVENPNQKISVYDHVYFSSFMRGYMKDQIIGIINNCDLLDIKDFKFGVSPHLYIIYKEKDE